MRVADAVEFIAFGDRTALFHQGLQQLVELNDTASLIWRGLAAGERPSAVSASLALRGARQDHAAQFVEEALETWLRGGWLVPDALAGGLKAPAKSVLNLSILDVGFAVLIHGGPTPDGVVELLTPLKGDAPQKHRFDIVSSGDGYFLLVDDHSRGWFGQNELAPALKAALTEGLTQSIAEGFLAHGALLEASGRRLFLSGAPGAGKSTLALALVGAGFRCLSDDIVHVDPHGRMKGAPFALTLKRGSWSLAPDFSGMIDALPIHRRADGRDVRYAGAQVTKGAAGPLSAFITLERKEGAGTALEPMSRLDALRSLLEGSLAPSRRISAAEVKALCETFAEADCYGLSYSNLQDAVTAISGLIHG